MTPAQEIARRNATLDAITHRTAFANARRMANKNFRRQPNWVFAMDLYDLGSTYAWAMCERMGLDPEAKTATPYPATPPGLAEAPKAPESEPSA